MQTVIKVLSNNHMVVHLLIIKISRDKHKTWTKTMSLNFFLQVYIYLLNNLIKIVLVCQIDYSLSIQLHSGPGSDRVSPFSAGTAFMLNASRLDPGQPPLGG